jgi:hypothetical protein
MSSINVKNKIEIELKSARAGRDQGNEGQARVCARRAAGFAIREYLKGHSEIPPNISIFDLFTLVEALPDFPDEGKQIASRMQLRVDKDHQLPNGIDLIADAQRLLEIFCFE